MDILPWAGFLLPTGTPPTIVARLYDELIKAANHPDVRNRLDEEAALALSSSPEAFRAFIVAEQAKFARIIKTTGIRLEP